MTLLFKILSKLRAIFFSKLYCISIKSAGRGLIIAGRKFIKFSGNIRFGNDCWIEAVFQYREFNYYPNLYIGHDVMMSNHVHVSCVSEIHIGNQTLIGSNVYIGDHSHGSSHVGKVDLSVPPYERPLDDIGTVHIGDRVWIGDGSVILAGTYLCDGCIVGANTVVKGKFTSPCVIAGMPAKVIRVLI